MGCRGPARSPEAFPDQPSAHAANAMFGRICGESPRLPKLQPLRTAVHFHLGGLDLLPDSLAVHMNA